MIQFRYIYGVIFLAALVSSFMMELPLFARFLLPIWVGVMFLINEYQIHKKRVIDKAISRKLDD